VKRVGPRKAYVEANRIRKRKLEAIVLDSKVLKIEYHTEGEQEYAG